MANGSEYKLTINETAGKAAYTPQTGDKYVLYIGSKRSTGTVSAVSGSTFTLKPSNGSIFTVTVSGNGLIAMNGTITLDDGTTESAPVTLTSVGRLTVTNIPAKYNGKFAIAVASDGSILAVESFITNVTGGAIAAKIVSGSVTLELYTLNEGSDKSVNGYNGSDTVDMIFVINSSKDFGFDDDPGIDNDIIAYGWGTVKFSNGTGILKAANVTDGSPPSSK
jgi:hypothetical protein